MDIKHEQGDKNGEFYIDENGKRLARLAYSESAPGKITIFHTEVDDKFRGEGIGQDMVAAAVDYARKNNLKVVATCPYAKKVIDRTPEFQDVLA